MPDDWIPNCGTQLERAIRAHFIDQGAATADDCFISNESEDRTGLAAGITTIRAASSQAADGSGNEVFQVVIQNKFGVRGNPEEENPKLNRTELDRRVGRQMLALLSGDEGRTDLNLACSAISIAGNALATIDPDNEADMEEFTCLFGRYLGMTRGAPDDASCAWVEVRNFEFTAAPSAIS